MQTLPPTPAWLPKRHLTHNHHTVVANPSINANLPTCQSYILQVSSQFHLPSSPLTYHPLHSQYQIYSAATLPPSPIRHPPSPLPAAAAAAHP